jgi:glycosyltransferase involved in cell wall biosynthesis
VGGSSPLPSRRCDMHVLVASALQASSHWAHAINTVKMAEGFAKLGHKVTILCRQSAEGKLPPEKLGDVYGLRENLRWTQVPDVLLGRPVGQHWGFALLASPVALWEGPELVFARSYVFPWVTSKLGIPTVAESHAHPRNSTAPFLRFVEATKHRGFRLCVTISQRLADHYHTLGVPREKLIVLPDAVDVELFQEPHQLPASPYQDDGPNVTYAGHLYDYKGIPTILETARQLPDVRFHLVGGWPKDVEQHKRRARELRLDNVTFHGLKPHASVPPFLWHADVLLLPPSLHHPSAEWTSPLKLGEYLASGTPVVATRIPALRDWLTRQEVEFVEPDNPRDLAEGIQRVLHSRGRAESLSTAGRVKARSLSYEKRAEAILEHSGFGP